MKQENRKGSVEVITVILLLLVVTIASFGLFKWFIQFQSDWEAKMELNGDIDKVELLGLVNYDSSTVLIGTRNLGKSYHIVNKVLIDGSECTLKRSNIIQTVDPLYVDCPLTLNEHYKIEVFTDKGIYSKTFTVDENSWNIQAVGSSSSSINTTVYYGFGACGTKGDPYYNINDTSNSHAELYSQGNYPYTVCIKHRTLPLGNSCSGNFTTLFYLGNVTNSHIWRTNASPYPSTYNWQQICVNTTGNSVIDTQVSTSAPNDFYACVGSIDRDDYIGGMIGNCNAYNQKIWLRID